MRNDGRGESGGYPFLWPSAVGQGTHEALIWLDKPPGGLDGQHLLVLLGDPPLKLQGQTRGVVEGEEAGGGAAHPGGLEEDAFGGVQLQLQWLLPALHAHLLGSKEGGLTSPHSPGSPECQESMGW